MKKVVIALFILLGLLAGAAAGGWILLERAVGKPADLGATAEIIFVVPRGSSAQALGRKLVSENLITDARLWRYHLWRRGGLVVKAGRFRLTAAMNIPEIAHALEGAPMPEDEPFSLIEGWRLRDTDAALAAKGWARAGAYLEAAANPQSFHADFPLPGATLEGYLYPETYGVVPTSVDVHALVQRQLDMFASRFATPYRDEIAKSPRSLHEIVVMASILEREEPVPENRALVAGILWKRLDGGYPLGVDATSRYLLPEWNDRKAFLVQLRDGKSPWNTRINRGLPPGPIGAPSIESLVAALRPAHSEFWFYLHDAGGHLHPSRNGTEHEALRKKFNVF